MKFQLSPASGCRPPDRTGKKLQSRDVAVGSKPPSEPKARKNKTSAWSPKLHSPMKFQVSSSSICCFIMNFWTLPVTVRGYSLTNLM